MNRRIVPAALALAAGLALASPTAAQAAAAPDRELKLSIIQENGTHRSVGLDCITGESDHPLAKEACAALESVNGDIPRLGRNGFCLQVWQPVTARAEGVWNGRPLTFQATYSNACHMHLATGPVFRF